MDDQEKQDLYEEIDDDEDMTDAEKREAYSGEIYEEEARERWEDEQSGF